MTNATRTNKTSPRRPQSPLDPPVSEVIPSAIGEDSGGAATTATTTIAEPAEQRPQPPSEFSASELPGSSGSVSLRWSVPRRSTVLIERKLPGDAGFVRLGDPIPTAAQSTRSDSKLPSDTLITYRIACIEGSQISDWLFREIRTSDRIAKSSAMKSIREQIADEEAENERIRSENRKIALKRYVEILRDPDASTGAGQVGDLRAIMVDLNISAAQFERDAALLKELADNEKTVAANPAIDPARMAKINAAHKQAEKDFQQAEKDLLNYRASGGMHMRAQNRIKEILAQRPEFRTDDDGDVAGEAADPAEPRIAMHRDEA